MKTRLPKLLIILLIISPCFFTNCKIQKTSENNIAALAIEKKVNALVASMTLEEKIGQMSQVRHFDENTEGNISTKFIGSVIHTQGPTPGKDASEWQAKFIALQKKALSTRLGIPLLFAVDAVHGQNTYEGATIFPHAIGQGATQNSELVEDIAAATAIEAQATGFNWVFSPCLAIPYNEKWGRVYEGFSESTELTQELARAAIKGYQGKLSDKHTVMATAKHYIADGATDFGMEGGTSTLTRSEVSERLLPPYKAAVDEGVGAIMSSFNSLDGSNMHAHKELIRDTLKGAYNFDGIMVSDWKGYSRFGGQAIINAGIDMVMAVDGELDPFQNGLRNAVDSGYVSLDRIDDAVRRILRKKYSLGLFENPFPDSTLIANIGNQQHRDLARQAVRESLVLLKNDNKLLPLNKNASKIVVVGEHANNAGLQSGGWTINWQGTTENYQGATTLLEGIQKIAKGEVVYDKDASGVHTDADVAIIVVGETPYAEFFGDIGDGKGKYKLTLTEIHQNYINAYADQGIKVVVVLISGRPLVTTKQIEQSDAFVAAWFPGSEGDGIAEVLFGDTNFKGKLPHSWPKSVEDYQGKYGPNFWNDESKPLFPFGYGMQYL